MSVLSLVVWWYVENFMSVLLLIIRKYRVADGIGEVRPAHVAGGGTILADFS